MLYFDLTEKTQVDDVHSKRVVRHGDEKRLRIVHGLEGRTGLANQPHLQGCGIVACETLQGVRLRCTTV